MFLQIYDFFLKTGNVGPFILRRGRARAAPWHGHGMVFEAVSDAVQPLLTVPVQPRRKATCNILADRTLYPAMQKVAFRAAKGHVSGGERWPFARRKGIFHKTAGGSTHATRPARPRRKDVRAC